MGDLKISLLNFGFVMIYIIHKILLLLKNHMNYLKDNIFKCFFKEYHRLLEKLRPKEENIIKDIRNLLRLKKMNKITLQLKI